MGGREVLEVVGHDGVEDERLHQVPVAWTPTTTRSTVSLIILTRGHPRVAMVEWIAHFLNDLAGFEPRYKEAVNLTPI